MSYGEKCTTYYDNYNEVLWFSGIFVYFMLNQSYAKKKESEMQFVNKKTVWFSFRHFVVFHH